MNSARKVVFWYLRVTRSLTLDASSVHGKASVKLDTLGSRDGGHRGIDPKHKSKVDRLTKHFLMSNGSDRIQRFNLKRKSRARCSFRAFG